MKLIKQLTLMSGGLKVGELMAGANRQIGFQYAAEWLSTGYSLSPLRLPFNASVQVADTQIFAGLHGVFADSLPDGWGLLLMDRFLQQQGLARSEIGVLDRLAYIGTRAMGALEYHPATRQSQAMQADLLALSESARQFVAGDTAAVLEELTLVGGSPGGARPKVTVAFNDDMRLCISGVDAVPAHYTHWLVKFHAQNDSPYSGAVEKIYADMARLAGLNMPENCLIEVGENRFFAVRRFDREGNVKKHVISLAGLLHADFRLPSLDYEALLGATGWLTKSLHEVAMAYRLAVFNVLSGNRDDHAKNFSFVYDREWKFSPVYDLTLSNDLHQHSTAMLGAGLPTKAELDKLGKKFGVTNALEIQQQVRAAIAQWGELSADLLPKKVAAECAQQLTKIDRRVFASQHDF